MRDRLTPCKTCARQCTFTTRSELLYELSRSAHVAQAVVSAAPAWQQQQQQQGLTGWPLADYSGVGQPLKQQQPQQLPPFVCAPAAEPVPFQQLLLQQKHPN